MIGQHAHLDRIRPVHGVEIQVIGITECPSRPIGCVHAVVIQYLEEILQHRIPAQIVFRCAEFSEITSDIILVAPDEKIHGPLDADHIQIRIDGDLLIIGFLIGASTVIIKVNMGRIHKVVGRIGNPARRRIVVGLPLIGAGPGRAFNHDQ
ncbi:hypothetical protein MKZ09_07675 [Paenibacillus sp. FSL R5-0908]|uniref:hypothetical protein n=1 Tax=Paenibacillus sp. FSL R5-0908 TaxID=2921664 RepID=UPI002694C4E8